MDDFLDTSWLSQATIDGMGQEFVGNGNVDSSTNQQRSAWKTADLLLEKTIALKDQFFWQSHTLSHLARDDLGVSDCYTEDTGKQNKSMVMFGDGVDA